MVDQDLCNPNECDLECYNACVDIHGTDSPLTYGKGDRFPQIRRDVCTGCLRCFRACPKNAIKTETNHGKPKKKEPMCPSAKTRRPYLVSMDWERFSEADMIFARVHNDPDFKNYDQNEWYGAENMIAKNMPGYGRFEHHLAASGWALYDSRIKINPRKTDYSNERGGSKKATMSSKELTSAIKRAARFYGADLVGIIEVDPRWLYSQNRNREDYTFPERLNRAIVIAVEMDYNGIATSPAFTSSATTALGYSRMAFVEIELADFIRSLGYAAVTTGNDIGLSVPMAIDAGLGMIGRHGILITKEFGPRVRIAKVLTDMPLHPDAPDMKFCESVTSFCRVCEKCATSCPSQSIPYGNALTWEGVTRSNNPGAKKWYINPETCYNFWIENGSECSNCIRSCPYNKENSIFHKFIVWLTQNVPWLNRLVVKFDDLAGFGKQKNPLSYLRRFE
ncbi:MAG: reductive dehalogenase [Candidatus Thorarchaeota archaeon]